MASIGDSIGNLSGPLWEQGKKIFYEEIGDAKGEKVKDSTKLDDVMESLKIASTKASKEYGEHSLRKDKRPIITVKLSRIMQRLEVLLKIGDSYMQAAPETVSLVWMAFRIIFTGFTKDMETCAILTDAVDQMTDIIFVCSIFEKRYLDKNGIVQAAQAIKDRILAQIPPLYAVVLKFSYQSRKLFAHGKLIRSVMSWRSQELEDTLSSAQQKRRSLQDTADIGFQEATLETLRNLQIDSGLIRGVFDVLESEVIPGIRNLQAGQAESKEFQIKEDIDRRFKDQMNWIKSGSVADIALPGRTLNANLLKTHPGTADWVLSENIFETWRDAQGSRGLLLWLYGEGGFGKSFLASSIIAHLSSDEREWGMPKPQILYFFCSRGDEATSQGSIIFLHLLMQLFEKASTESASPNLELQGNFCRIIEDAWRKLKTEAKHDSSLVQLKSVLQPIFEDLVQAIGTVVFIVIDGLDECIDLDDGLMDTLNDLPSSSKGRIMVLISSRPETCSLAPQDYISIEVTRSRTQAQIAKYVKAKMKAIKRFTPAMRKKASEVIAEKSEGNFRYANVVIENLNQPQAKMTPFPELLANLPQGMTALYRRAMASLDAHQRRLLVVALRWLMCSQSQININLIADELECTWESQELDLDDNDNDNASGASDSGDEESDYGSYAASDDDDSQQSRKESTPFGQENRKSRDIEKDLRSAGREFLTFWSSREGEGSFGQIVQMQHNSVRDFVLEEEKLIEQQVERCEDCKKRFQETIAHEAGPKRGHVAMCKVMLQRLNSRAFAEKYILLPPSSELAEENPESPAIVEKSDSNPVSSPKIEEKKAETEGDLDSVELGNPASPTNGQEQSDVPSHPALAISTKVNDSAKEEEKDPIPTVETVAENPQPDEEDKGSNTGDSAAAEGSDAWESISNAASTESQASATNDEPQRYEILNWPHHFRAITYLPPEDVSSDIVLSLFNDLEKFLRVDTAVYQSWLRRAHPWRLYKTFDHPLHTAARYGLEILLDKYVLEQKCDINMKNENGDTPLHLACCGDGDFMGINFLIENGADVNAQNEEGQTPLLVLLDFYGPTKEAKVLVDHGAKADVKSEDGVTALHLATQLSDTELCEIILKDKNVDVNAKDNLQGETPLHWAFKWSLPPLPMLELLIENGANVNEQDNDSQAPLYEACNVGDAPGTRLLLEKGADVDDDENVFGRTALHAAIAAGSLDTVQVLVEWKADLTLTNSEGQDALAQAADFGRLDILDFIIDTLRDREQLSESLMRPDTLEHWIPLHVAASNQNLGLVEKLSNLGDFSAMTAAQDRRGDTPLHVAAKSGAVDVVLFFIDRDVDVTVKNHFNLAPVDVARMSWQEEAGDLPDLGIIGSVIALAEKAPEVARQPFALIVDIETPIKTPLCNLWSDQRDVQDATGWTALALAKQLKRQYKVDDLLKGAADVPAIVGSPITKLGDVIYHGKATVIEVKVAENELEASCMADIERFGPIPYDYFNLDWKERPTLTGGGILSDNPIQAGLDMFYFEVEFISTPAIPYPYCSIGLMYERFPREKKPVTWFWSNRGPGARLFTASYAPIYYEQESPYSEPFGVKGDVVGCGIDFKRDTLFYTKNGARLPIAFGSVRGRLFPCISLYPCDVSVRVNFGTDESKPFKFANWKESIEEHKDDEPLVDEPLDRSEYPEAELTHEDIRLLRRKELEPDALSSPVTPM